MQSFSGFNLIETGHSEHLYVEGNVVL